MAGRVVITLDVDAKGAVTGIRGVEGGLARLDRTATGATAKVGLLGRSLAALKANAVIAGIAAVYGAFRLLGDAIGDARVQQVAERKLEQALRNTGAAGAEAAEGLKRLAAETQRASNYGDEAILTAQAMLLSFREVGGERGAGMLTQSLVDMAAGIEKAGGGAQDLNQIALILGRSLTQGAGALTRVGISLSDTQKAAFDAAEGLDRVRILTEVVEDNFGGMAAATVDDSRQMANAVGDLKEALGEGLLKATNEVAAELRRLAEDEGVVRMVRALGEVIAEAVRQSAEFVRVLAAVSAGLSGVEDRAEGAALAAGHLEHDLRTTVGTVRTLAELVGWLAEQASVLLVRVEMLGAGVRKFTSGALAGLLSAFRGSSGPIGRFVYWLNAAQGAANLDLSRARAEIRGIRGEADAATASLRRFLAQSVRGRPLHAHPEGGGGGGFTPPAPVPVPLGGPSGGGGGGTAAAVADTADATEELSNALTVAREESARLEEQLAAIRDLSPEQVRELDAVTRALGRQRAALEALQRAAAVRAGTAPMDGLGGRGPAALDAEVAALRDVEAVAIEVGQTTAEALLGIANNYQGAISNILGGLADVFRSVGGESKAAFAAFKALAIAEAVIAGILAVQKTLPNIPAAVGMAALAAANVARIATTSMGGGASVGGGVAARPSASSPQGSPVAAGVIVGGRASAPPGPRAAGASGTDVRLGAEVLEVKTELQTVRMRLRRMDRDADRRLGR